jgi:hypothetical protein
MVCKLVYFSFQCISSTWDNFNMTECFYLLQKVDFAGELYMGYVTSIPNSVYHRRAQIISSHTRPSTPAQPCLDAPSQTVQRTGLMETSGSTISSVQSKFLPKDKAHLQKHNEVSMTHISRRRVNALLKRRRLSSSQSQPCTGASMEAEACAKLTKSTDGLIMRRKRW